MRQSPGVDVVQTGQMGGVTSLFVRGGNSTANKVLIDGIPAEDVGGTLRLRHSLDDAAVAGLEIYRGPDSALYGTDAGASVVNLRRRAAVRPSRWWTTRAMRATSTRTATKAALSGAHKQARLLWRRSRASTPRTRCPWTSTTRRRGRRTLATT